MTTIEPLSAEHFVQVAAWLSVPEINKWLSGEWRNREINPTILAIAARNKKNRLFFVRHQGAPCGLVALADVDTADSIAMVWYILGDPTFARKGITSEALRQLSRIAFDEIGLASIHAWIMENNVASRRVLEKSGFKECGRFRKAALSNENQVDRIYFDLIP